ncbi:hypothetical protein TREMEDRAFT_31392 [Tremella mesenterica DSM 1558]|uniref:uncharacterized protein n=1 Tax=Tremella mesenterica (strain ATCC 24925 / CBS 8224 / DSM 1558 / NBRC 9311 / NRRL Y-6157 / RJB 2259-6 / UBC 559-6) TaxID=578456 RepID=UPI0003F4A19C|nr:uncharacterized protein TREMEDRAFT_31392 [Tremella mesenterica DSM 1558]EIW69175.1 hypothetical protein TREMEDRAFT_31392 [Tremella mesenterica DSM 1558]
MGNGQSHSSDGPQQPQRPPDYYHLLDVDQDATFDEIKRAYKRLALVNHPDRNLHRIEEATRLFADLQQAYEVLSDPNERAFYDSHRNAPIPTTDDDLYDHVRAGDAAAADPKSKLNRRQPGDPGLRLEQLLRFFDPKLARKLDDTEEGFFSIYRTLFALIASDERLHTPKDRSPLVYPSFGDSKTSYAPPPGLTRAQRDEQLWARDFYTVWLEFTTEKRFEWLSKWDADRGEDRATRRLMEKGNKKIREDHRKEYTDTVRQLAQFIQHRDPRYKVHQAHLKQQRSDRKVARSSKPDKNPSGPPRHVAGMPSARQNSPDIEYLEQEWQRLVVSDSSDEEEEEQDLDGEAGVRVVDDVGGEAIECVACGKVFQSEASWLNHERSKRHKQTVWRLKRDMQLENSNLDLESQDPLEARPASASGTEIDEAVLALNDDLTGVGMEETKSAVPSNTSSSSSSSISANDLAQTDTPELVNTPVVNGAALAANGIHTSEAPIQSSSQPSKREKRRAKEAQKKVEEEQRKTATKEARKTAKKAGVQLDTTGQQEEKGRKKETSAPNKSKKANVTKGAKGKATPPSDLFDEVKLDRVHADILEKRAKLLDRWGPDWFSKSILGPDPFAPLKVLCLGLGAPSIDRTAQIQLSLLLALVAGLDSQHNTIEAFDPVWDEWDRRLLDRFGINALNENLCGAYRLDPGSPYLLFLPHCPRPLYESLLSTNFDPSFSRGRVLFGNDLADYVPGLMRLEEIGEPVETEFVKPKKKRRPKDGGPAKPRDGVLQRLGTSSFQIQP